MWGSTDLQNDCSNSLENFGILWKRGVWAPFLWILAQCWGVDLHNSIFWFLLSLWPFFFFPALLKDKANTFEIFLGFLPRKCPELLSWELHHGMVVDVWAPRLEWDQNWNFVLQTGGKLSPELHPVTPAASRNWEKHREKTRRISSWELK